jgi:catechol 2,3-dioxygenase-like lactoylglutathione lyase family enzyme
MGALVGARLSPEACHGFDCTQVGDLEAAEEALQGHGIAYDKFPVPGTGVGACVWPAGGKGGGQGAEAEAAHGAGGSQAGWGVLSGLLADGCCRRPLCAAGASQIFFNDPDGNGIEIADYRPIAAAMK